MAMVCDICIYERDRNEISRGSAGEAVRRDELEIEEFSCVIRQGCSPPMVR